MATWDMKTFSPPHFGELALPTHHLPPTPAGPPDWLRLWWRPTALSNRGPTVRQGLLASSVVVLGCGSVGALPLRRRRSCARACTGARGNVAHSGCVTAGATSPDASPAPLLLWLAHVDLSSGVRGFERSVVAASRVPTVAPGYNRDMYTHTRSFYIRTGLENADARQDP